MNNFRTSDLNVAAFLQEAGFRLVASDRQNGHVTFIFDDPEGAAQGAVMSYLNGAAVQAIRYADRLRHLKTMVLRGVSV